MSEVYPTRACGDSFALLNELLREREARLEIIAWGCLLLARVAANPPIPAGQLQQGDALLFGESKRFHDRVVDCGADFLNFHVVPLRVNAVSEQHHKQILLWVAPY